MTKYTTILDPSEDLQRGVRVVFPGSEGRTYCVGDSIFKSEEAQDGLYLGANDWNDGESYVMIKNNRAVAVIPVTYKCGAHATTQVETYLCLAFDVAWQG